MRAASTDLLASMRSARSLVANSCSSRMLFLLLLPNCPLSLPSAWQSRCVSRLSATSPPAALSSSLALSTPSRVVVLGATSWASSSRSISLSLQICCSSSHPLSSMSAPIPCSFQASRPFLATSCFAFLVSRCGSMVASHQPSAFSSWVTLHAWMSTWSGLSVSRSFLLTFCIALSRCTLKSIELRMRGVLYTLFFLYSKKIWESLKTNQPS